MRLTRNGRSYASGRAAVVRGSALVRSSRGAVAGSYVVRLYIKIPGRRTKLVVQRVVIG